jgi:hypothetical protein
MNDTTVGALAITFSVLVLMVPGIRYDGMTDERTVTPGDRNKRLQGQTRDSFAEPAGRKPSFPTDAVAQTAAVFAALASAGGPTDAAAIAASFRKTKALENMISDMLASLARLGHVSTKDGKSFEIRRAA